MGDWRTLLMVGLDAMRAGQIEDAEAIWDQLDRIEPGWQERVAHPDRDVVIESRKRNTRRRVVAWVLLRGFEAWEVACLFGVQSAQVKLLAAGGEMIVKAKCQLGDLEEDFVPAEQRREARRQGHSFGRVSFPDDADRATARASGLDHEQSPWSRRARAK